MCGLGEGRFERGTDISSYVGVAVYESTQIRAA